MLLQDETLIQTIRRAFPAAQRLLAGLPAERGRIVSVAWHNTEVNPETGAAAVVRAGGPLEDLVGQVVLVKRTTSTGTALPQAFVYVVGTSAAVVADLSLARRAFAAVAPLSADRVTLTVARL